jgi:DNA polymerase elongation subunit (family B)
MYYGSLGNNFSRFFDIRNAEAITLSGQLAIRWKAKKFNEFLSSKFGDGEYVLYIDTDSCVGDTLVYVNGEKVKIEDLYDMAGSKFMEYDEPNQNYVKDTRGLGLKTKSVGSDLSLNEREITYVMKHKVKKRMFEISVEGKSVIVTEDHSVMVQRDGKLISVKPLEMEADDLCLTLEVDSLRYTDDWEVSGLGIQEMFVYDIEVEEDHNFFGNDILIHNSNYLNLEPFLKAIGKQDAPVKEQIRLMDEFCKKFLDKVVEDGYQELMEQQNAYEQALQSKREALADVGFWVSKKRYALSVHNSEGVEYETPKVKVLGLEVVRSSTPAAIKEPLKNTIKTILYSGEPQLQAYVTEMRKLFDTLTNDEIASASGVSDIEKYIDGEGYKSGCPKHVKAAIFHNKLVKVLGLEHKYPLIKSGDKIKFLELKMPNPLKEEVIGFIGKLPTEFKLDKYVDRDGMFEKIYMSAVENITSKIGWQAVPIASLEEFFG